MEMAPDYKTRFEFQLKINENIIVQRNFSIKGYNNNAKSSIEFIDVLYDCSEMIEQTIKTAAIDHLTEFAHMYISENFENLNVKDTYHFQILVDEKIIGEKIFDASVYPTKVRYAVNIRKEIPIIIAKLQKLLSSKDNDLTYEYMGYELRTKTNELV